MTCSGKDDQPYCEKDYQARFGIKCAHCQRFITGKVLQAGEDSHFHPTCARCSKCGDPFGDGEEMYLQGKLQFTCLCGKKKNGDFWKQNQIVFCICYYFICGTFLCFFLNNFCYFEYGVLIFEISLLFSSNQPERFGTPAVDLVPTETVNQM